ncbi:unnamed protein product [Protopolystoma xenopodis]|uniref:TRPM-like domain-containing protein n=1 Tax=Protopolystoma xenopodis TaxID=117903 RepID=A0A3S5BVE4_9PLAT|nr:unnamed protein product [Protopolystoma xenopodis]
MAKYLWSLEKESIPSALMAAMMLRRMAKSVDDETDKEDLICNAR